VEIDNYVCEWFIAAPLRAENQDGLPIFDKPPGRREAELALVIREEASPTALRMDKKWRRRSGQETLDPGTLVTDAEVQPRCGRRPHDFAKPQPRRPPVILDQTSRVVTPQPCCEVVQLVTIGKDRRQTHDTPVVRVRTPKEPLDLYLITNLALIETDHMAFIENEKANVIKK
jgi:hypothetical protein